MRKLAPQQKEQQALKTKNRILRQIHYIKLAENLSPITKKLDESTKKISEVINPSNCENENTQGVVSVEVEVEDSEDENIDNK